MEGSNYWGYGYKTQHSYPRSWLNHLKKARGDIWPKHSEEETTQKLIRWGQKVRNEKKNSQIKKPHLKMIPIKNPPLSLLSSKSTLTRNGNNCWVSICGSNSCVQKLLDWVNKYIDFFKVIIFISRRRLFEFGIGMTPQQYRIKVTETFGE